ncbi:MAG: class B sortase [Eubacteriaceae bacterium]|nr:class B sortase [Eubacteriaceae bacterium]
MEYKKEIVWKSRVYRVKTAPFDNPFDLGRKAMESSAEQASTDGNAAERKSSNARRQQRPMRLFEAVFYCAAIAIFSFSTFLGAMEVIPRLISKNRIINLRNDGKLDETYEVEEALGSYSRQVPNFPALQEKCADLVGWMYLEAVGVDDPIVRGKDNDYYLNHSYESLYDKAGSFFVDYRAKADLSSQNTVIYGHNMSNGTMFASLRKYLEQETYEAQPVISIYTPDNKVYHYQIFAVVIVDSYYDYMRSNYGENFTNFINRMRKQSRISSSASVGASDRVLCLSTCDSDDYDDRLVVMAVLLNQDGNIINTAIKP